MARLPGSYRVLHDRVATGEAVLVAEPLKNFPGRVPLLLARAVIILQNLMDDRQEFCSFGFRR